MFVFLFTILSTSAAQLATTSGPFTTLTTPSKSCPFVSDANGGWKYVDQTLCVLKAERSNWFKAAFPCGRAEAETCQITFVTPLVAEEIAEKCGAGGIPIPAGVFRVNAMWRSSARGWVDFCLLYTSPSPRDKRQSRMPSSA